jgi:hypothetical protein
MFRKSNRTHCFFQAGIPAPRGWSKEESRDNPGIVIFTPSDLKAGEEYAIAIYPLQNMNKAEVEVWLEKAVKADPLVANKHTKVDMKPKNSNIAVATVARKSGGVLIAYLYFGMSLDQESGMLVRVRSNNLKINERYSAEETSLTAAAMDIAKKEIIAAGRGMNIEKELPTPPGMTPGGKMLYGIYEGHVVSRDYSTKEVKDMGMYEIHLYEGELRAIGKSEDTYKYYYDPRTGKFNASYGALRDLANDNDDPREQYCVYGYDAAGKPYLYASKDWGFSRRIATLRYIGPNKRPSEKEEKVAKEAAEAEARRYKFVVPAGKGIQPEQVAHVLYHLNFQTANGFSTSVEIYLLLKDGTIRDDIPVPIDEMDMSLSRRKEPEKWGKWRRQGEKFLVAWPDRPNHYEPLEGVSVAVPAKRNEKLQGTWKATASFGDMTTGVSIHNWAVTFTPDGRFEKSRSGSSGNGTMAQTLNGVYIGTNYDDEGSSVSVSTPNVAGGSSSKSTKKGSDRRGTYSFNGYLVVLRYDNGREERIPFFFQSSGRESIYFEGSSMLKDK